MTVPKRPHQSRYVPNPEPPETAPALPISGGLLAGICIGVSLGVIGIGLFIYTVLTKDTPAPVIAENIDRREDRKSRPVPQLSENAFLTEQEKAKRKADAYKINQKTELRAFMSNRNR